MGIIIEIFKFVIRICLIPIIGLLLALGCVALWVVGLINLLEISFTINGKKRWEKIQKLKETLQ